MGPTYLLTGYGNVDLGFVEHLQSALTPGRDVAIKTAKIFQETAAKRGRGNEMAGKLDNFEYFSMELWEVASNRSTTSESKAEIATRKGCR